MVNGSLSALGPGGALDLRDEGHTQTRALASVDRIQLERLDFQLADSQGPFYSTLIRTAAVPGSVETGAGRTTPSTPRVENANTRRSLSD